MGWYHIVIPFVPHESNAKDKDKLSRFKADLQAASVAEARKLGAEKFLEMRVATGFRPGSQVDLQDIFIKEFPTETFNPLSYAYFPYKPGVYCMQVIGAMDSQTSLQLDRDVHELQKNDARALILDLSRVHPLSSTGLGMLLSLHDRLKLSLVSVPDNAQRLMVMLGLDGTMNMDEDYQAALERLNS